MISIECAGCAGKGCSVCSMNGYIDLPGCPLELIDRSTWELLGYIDLYEKGLPPAAGGALDQSAGFIFAARFVFAEQQYYKTRLGIFS